MIKISVISGKPFIELTKSVDKSKIWFGGTLEYKISYKNIGSITATNLIIVDCLPLGVSYKELSNYEGSAPSVDIKCMSDFQILIFRLDDSVDINGTGEISFSVKVLE